MTKHCRYDVSFEEKKTKTLNNYTILGDISSDIPKKKKFYVISVVC